MPSLRICITLLALFIALIASWPSPRGAEAVATSANAVPAPEFAGIDRWFNSPPLTLKGLRGKVVLVEFWTHGCINCLHVLPHTKALYDRYKNDGLVVVGVHTPEYEEERDPVRVAAAIRKLGIDWPVAVDNGQHTWNAFGNRFWPALYLIDRDGRIVYRHVGEGNYDETEAHVRALLERG